MSGLLVRSNRTEGPWLKDKLVSRENFLYHLSRAGNSGRPDILT